MKHTKGNWKVGEGPRKEFELEINAYPNGILHTIAVVRGTRLNGHADLEANAKLIEAAPLMLKALEMSQEVLKANGLENSIAFTDNELAIKKAID